MNRDMKLSRKEFLRDYVLLIYSYMKVCFLMDEQLFSIPSENIAK